MSLIAAANFAWAAGSTGRCLMLALAGSLPRKLSPFQHRMCIRRCRCALRGSRVAGLWRTVRTLGGVRASCLLVDRLCMEDSKLRAQALHRERCRTGPAPRPIACRPRWISALGIQRSLNAGKVVITVPDGVILEHELTRDRGIRGCCPPYAPRFRRMSTSVEPLVS